jgi:hypothetical protein
LVGAHVLLEPARWKLALDLIDQIDRECPVIVLCTNHSRRIRRAREFVKEASRRTNRHGPGTL